VTDFTDTRHNSSQYKQLVREYAAPYASMLRARIQQSLILQVLRQPWLRRQAMSVDLWATLGINLPQVFAGIVVALFAWKRYGTPTSNRSSTTRVQFQSTCCAYVSCALALYLVLASLLENPEAAKFLTFGIQLPEGAANLSTPFVAALFLTTLLPSIPFLCGIDTALLKFFQRLGSIPIEIRRLRHDLKEMGYAPTQKTEVLVRSYLNAYPKILTNRLMFGRGNTTQHDFTRILCLYCELKELDEKSGFLSDFVDEEVELKKLVELVCAQAAIIFRSPRQKTWLPTRFRKPPWASRRSVMRPMTRSVCCSRVGS
jgi:hypothetical protein